MALALACSSERMRVIFAAAAFSKRAERGEGELELRAELMKMSSKFSSSSSSAAAGAHTSMISTPLGRLRLGTATAADEGTGLSVGLAAAGGLAEGE